MKKFCIGFLSIIIALLAVFFVLPLSSGVAFASTSVYSDVLDDLQADENFNAEDYPVNQTDFSLTLMQLAESNDNCLLAYVYQPSAGKKDVLARKIRMSVDEGQTFADYSLTLLSKNGVFFKYKVDNYVTDYTSTVERSYQVVQIMRFASAELGDTVVDEHNNTISYIPYAVNWSFYAINHDGELQYAKEELETVIITEKYCGQLLFSNDHITDFLTMTQLGSQSSGMLHFIAFNTDVDIDKVCAADIAYTLIYCHESESGNIITALQELFGTGGNYHSEYRIPYYRTSSLSSEKEVSYKGGLFGHTYTWYEIMSKDDFVDDVVSNSSAFFDSGLTESGVSDLNGKEWVLCFLTTEITSRDTTQGFGTWSSENTCYYVTDETILELTYLKDGQLFVRGVVDNYQSGDGVPDNYENYGINAEWFKNLWEEIQEWLKIILIILGVILICVILYFLAPVIKFIFKIIIAPFKWIFGRSSKGKQKNKGKKQR